MAGYRRRRGKKAPRVDDLFYDNPESPDNPESTDNGESPDGAGPPDHAPERGDGIPEQAAAQDPTPQEKGPREKRPQHEPMEADSPGADSPEGNPDGADSPGADPGRRRGRAWWAAGLPWLRGLGVAAAAGALVAGAGLGEVDPVDAEQALGLPAAQDLPPVQEAGLSLVTDRLLVCPGPELIGLDDPTVAEPEQVVQVWGTAAPEDALPADLPEEALAAPGTVAVERSDDTLRDTDQRGETPRVQAVEDQWVQVHGTGALAAGTIGGQVHLGLEEQQRGLSTAPCGPAQEESWLVAGADEPGRVERLVLVNPTGNPVTADVEIFGADGPVDVAGGRGVVVPAGGRHVVLLDALAPGEPRPVVHVTTSGGPLVSVIGDRWLEGTVDRGLELVTPTAPPATEVVVPAVAAPRPDSADSATLRVGVPGAEAAVVQLRALTPEGPLRVDPDVVTVPAGSVTDIDLTELPEDTQGVEVIADVPVVAAAHLERRDAEEGPGDLAWVPAATPSEQLQGAVLARQGSGEPEPEYSRVLTVASVTGASASVTVVRGDQVSTEEVEVPAAGSAVLELDHEADSVWVRPTEGTVSAGVVTEVTQVTEGDNPEAEDPEAEDPEAEDPQAEGPLVAGMPLTPVPLSQQVRAVSPWSP